MAEPQTGYRLVIHSEGVDPHLIRDLLAEELDMHGTDAMRLAAHAPGVIPHELSLDKVRILVERLTQAGLDAEGWLADQLPDLSGPREVHRLQCLAGGLQTVGLRNEPEHWVPWSQIELISVGMVPQVPKQRRVESPGWSRVSGAAAATAFGPIASAFRPRVSKTIKVQQPSVVELWIVRNRPVQALRIHQEQMNYEYLADRLQSSSAANFRLFLEDLLRSAPQASITPATHSFLVYERPGRHHFSSSQQLMEYTTWQLLIRWRSQ